MNPILIERHERKCENRRKIKLLQQYLKVQAESREIFDSYREFKAKIISIQNVVITDMPKGCSASSDKLSGQMAKLEELEIKIANRLVQLVEIRQGITNAIEQLEDPNHRRVLSLRYLDGISWEEISVKMSYAWAQTHRTHSAALDKINI